MTVSPQEVDWLLLQISDLDSLSLRLESFSQRLEIPLTYSLEELTQLWQKRLETHHPLQYLIGLTPWRNFVLQVSPSVLIPRPETELIIDIVGKKTGENALDLGIWVDLGTGSGAIALGLAEVLTNATIYAVDISPEALEIAQANAKNLGLSSRISFLGGEWWQPLAHLQGQVGGMVSNPPYIPRGMIGQLQPEVSLFEPHLALDGGEDGLESIRYLVETSPLYLKTGGIWLVEMMVGQGEAIAELLEKQGNYKNIEIINDLAGLERFVLAFRR